MNLLPILSLYATYAMGFALEEQVVPGSCSKKCQKTLKNLTQHKIFFFSVPAARVVPSTETVASIHHIAMK
ncbi:hypothetical protein TNCT_540601, partial [Trichonephila clavata]